MLGSEDGEAGTLSMLLGCVLREKLALGKPLGGYEVGEEMLGKWLGPEVGAMLGSGDCGQVPN